MQDPNIFIERLIALKKKLNQQNMSLLAGAGLSKNISLRFPSWYELLFDMAREMFEPGIKTEYLLIKKQAGRSAKIESFENYLRGKVAEKIDSLGYLRLVSEYIRRKGYREVIESYIEERTPRIIQENGELYLEFNSGGKLVKEPIPENKMLLHRKLCELPWNNIYTTNYDNGIEVSLDKDIKQRLLNKISDLTDEIDQLESELTKLKPRVEELTSKVRKLEEAEAEEMSRRVSGIGATYSHEDKKGTEAGKEGGTIESLQDLRNELFNTGFTVDSKEIKIKENLEIIERLNGLLNDCYAVVTHSSQLSLKRNKNVIKLHGNLRDGKELGYGFDGDVHTHYVISEEDYQTYPQKHEAFTQLMRISLLQESFCLLGFSGIDPNFLAWIGWVRDIIHRNADTTSSTCNDDKIYLVEASAALPPADKQLFYKNHRIAHIPILDINCIKFLEKETGNNIADKTSRSEVLLLLVEYLNDGLHISRPKAALELLEDEIYKKQWGALPLRDYKIADVSGLLKGAKGLKKSRGSMRISNLNFAYSHDKHTLLHFATAFSRAAKTDAERAELFGVIVIALQDQLLPYSIYNDEKVIDQLSEKVTDKEVLAEFRMLQLKDALWKGDTAKFNTLARGFNPPTETTRQEFTYLKILKAAVSLNFTPVKNALSRWKASGPWILKKAGLLAQFDPEGAIGLLEKTSQENLQDQLYHYHLLAYLRQGRKWKRHKPTVKKMKVIEAEGLKTIQENTDYLLEEVNKANTDIKPYGKDKFSVGTGLTLSNTDVRLQSFQYFGVLLESGFPLVVPRITFDSHKKTYPLIKNCLQYYPFIAVYMALHYSDHDFLKRFGQDCAYNDSLQEDIKLIAANLQQACFDKTTPQHFKDSILILFSELLVALKPETWEPFFLKVVDDMNKTGKLFADLRISDNDFILKGLVYIKQQSSIEKVIMLCLANMDKQSSTTSIHYLYQLAQNYWFAKKNFKIRSVRLRRMIKDLVAGIAVDTANAIFLLGNIESVLGAADKNAIRAMLKTADLDGVDNARVWHVILYFAEGDATVISKVKRAIVSHQKLWHSGITEKSGTYPFEYISLYKLRKKNDRSGISWTDKEKKLIFDKMLAELAKIEAFTKKRKDLTGYEGLLEEMLYFLEDEMLPGAERDKAMKRVKDLYETQKGYGGFMDGLLADDRQKVIWALNEVAKLIYQHKKIGDNYSFVLMIMNKLVLKSQPGLEACLHYLSGWLFDFRTEPGINSTSDLVVRIVETYYNKAPEDFEIPFLQTKLIKLAYVLKTWKVRSPIVSQVLALRKTTRFQNLLYELKEVPLTT